MAAFDIFENNCFSYSKWSAEDLISSADVKKTLESFKLCGRRIKHISAVGPSWLHSLWEIENIAFDTLSTLSEEERRLGSHFVNISPDMHFCRSLKLDLPFLLHFDDGDIFELDAPMEPVWLMTMNTLPKHLSSPYSWRPNIDIDALFSPCIGQKIIDVTEIPYPPGKHDWFIATLLETPMIERDYIEKILLHLENGITIELSNCYSFFTVNCLGNSGNTLTLPFGELKKQLWLSEDEKAEAAGQSYYEKIGWYSEGMCSVSTKRFDIGDLAYHVDYIELAGINGYICEDGTEVIKPQYVYANEFHGGIAIVAKGEWKEVSRSESGQPKYWTENEIWGGINYSGKEVIPFIFDQIRLFIDTNDYFIAHSGGRPNGAYGIIDRSGTWIAEPQFEWIDYEWNNGLIVFSYYNSEICDDLYGLYDALSKKTILKPVYNDIFITSDGMIELELYHTDYTKKNTILIDSKSIR